MSFASEVIQGLLSTGTARGGLDFTNVGATIGGIPQQQKDKQKEKEELARFNQISLDNQQGLAAAQEGDVTALQSSLDNLRKQMGLAETVEERRLIQKDLIALQKLMPGAKDTAVSNKAKEIFNLERSLKDPNLGANQKTAIQKKINDLKQDPLAMQEYNSLQMSQWTFEKTQKAVQSDEWIKTNSAAIDTAIRNGDTKEVDRLVKDSGEFSKAAQAYVNTSIKNRETLETFKENSLEKKKGPSVDFYESQIENLPEGVRDVLKADLDAYKETAKKWNPKTETWTEGSRTDAVKKEKSLQAKINAVFSQVALGDYQQERRIEQDRQEQIRKLEIELETPMGADYMVQGRILAKELQKDDKKPLTQNEVYNAANSLYQRDRRSKLARLAALTGKPQEQEEDNYESFSNEDQAIIDALVNRHPGKTRKQIIESLLKRGEIGSKEKQKTLMPSPDIPDFIGGVTGGQDRPIPTLASL